MWQIILSVAMSRFRAESVLGGFQISMAFVLRFGASLTISYNKTFHRCPPLLPTFGRFPRRFPDDSPLRSAMCIAQSQSAESALVSRASRPGLLSVPPLLCCQSAVSPLPGEAAGARAAKRQLSVLHVAAAAAAALGVLQMAALGVREVGSATYGSASNGSASNVCARPLHGKYVGEASMRIFTLVFRWRTEKTFHHDGTVDLEQWPLADPLSVIPRVQCRRVGVRREEENICAFHFEFDDCMRSAFSVLGLQLANERSVWDPPQDTIQFDVALQVPRISVLIVDFSFKLKREESPPRRP